MANPLKTAVVIGATGGIGGALTRLLAQRADVGHVHALSRAGTAFDGGTIVSGRIALDDESSIRAAAERVGTADLVICAAGLLHDPEADITPEKTWRHLNPEAMHRVFAVNTIGPALCLKHFLPRLTREGPSLMACLSARVGSISDNRLGGWYSYRASKAALNQLIRTAAIELARSHKNAALVGLHPGTVATDLSAPFQSGVPKDKLFTPEQSAGYLLKVMASKGPRDSGRVFAWDGSEVPP